MFAGCTPGCRGRKGMADLFERINRVERAMNSAEAQGSAIQQALNEDFGKLAVAAAEADAARSPKPDRCAKGLGVQVHSGLAPGGHAQVGVKRP